MTVATTNQFAELLALNPVPLPEYEILAIQPMASNYTSMFVFGTSASQSVNTTASKGFAVGMGGSDTLNGDSAANLLVGDYFAAEYIDYFFDDVGNLPVYDATMKGNDVLYGGGSDDLIITDGGNDTAYGGSGSDALTATAEKVGSSDYYGGDGHDELYFQDLFELGFAKVSASKLTFDAAHGIEAVYFWAVKLAGTDGDDVFDFSGTGVNFVDGNGNIVTPTIDMGAGKDRFNGNTADEDGEVNVFGNSGNDTLNGSGGRDTLDGGTGTDSLVGGLGADIYVVDSAPDIVKEAKVALTSALEEAGDTVQTTLAQYTLLNNFENLTYTGTVAFTGTGNSAANGMVGGAKADLLDGAGGADTIGGGLGADSLLGGAGKDLFVFDTAMGSGNTDALSDFSATEDTLWLEKSGAGLFNALATGALAADKFKALGSGSVDSNDRILYDSNTGKIFYDADGSGAGARVLFATVAVGTALTATDFYVI